MIDTRSNIFIHLRRAPWTHAVRLRHFRFSVSELHRVQKTVYDVLFMYRSRSRQAPRSAMWCALLAALVSGNPAGCECTGVNTGVDTTTYGADYGTTSFRDPKG